MANKKVPEPIRTNLGNIAYAIYSDIAGDVEGMEEMSTRDKVEIIRDANRMLTWAQSYTGKFNDDPVVVWLQENEYNPDYRQDMDRLVREAI